MRVKAIYQPDLGTVTIYESSGRWGRVTTFERQSMWNLIAAEKFKGLLDEALCQARDATVKAIILEETAPEPTESSE